MKTNNSELRAKLGDLPLNIRRGKSITKKQTIPGDIPVIAGGTKPSYYHNVANREGGVITVSGSGAAAGFVAYHATPIFASDCTTIQSEDAKLIDTLFIFYLLQNRQEEIYSFARGAAIPHVYPSDIAGMEIVLPPLAEQKEIAAKLQKQIATTNRAIAAAENELRELRALPAAMLRAVFPPPPLKIK